MQPLPSTDDDLPLMRAGFAAVPEALDYAARGRTGFTFYDAKGAVRAALPYRDLRERALSAARGLTGAGLAWGSRLLLVADTDPEVVTLFFACQYAGIVPVPVALPAGLGGRDAYVATLRRQLESSGARAAAAPEALVGFLGEAAAGLGVEVGPPAAFLDRPGGDAEPRPFGPGDPCYLQYSSGSTSFPKGIDVTQACLAANAYGIANHGLDVRVGDRCASWLPLYHDMGLVGFLLTPLFCQLSVDYLATRDFGRRPRLWLQLISRNRGSLGYSPSFGYDLCVRGTPAEAAAELDLSCWRVAGVGGDMIQPPVLERFAEAFGPRGFRRGAFVPSYGMAETTLAVSVAPLGRGVVVERLARAPLAERDEVVPAAADDAEPLAFVRCGPPLPGHEVEVRDAEDRPLPERRVGRIVVRGPSVTAGYVGDAEASAAAYRDGWLHTGDLGYLTDGEVVITGRSKDLIILNGRNIWPHDLEWAAETLPSLRRGDVAAFQVDHADRPPEIVLLVQCRAAGDAARAELVREVRRTAQQTAGVDVRVVPVPPHALPQTSSGKLSRARAKAGYLEGAYPDPAASDG